jgi:hypothetical protein
VRRFKHSSPSARSARDFQCVEHPFYSQRMEVTCVLAGIAMSCCCWVWDEAWQLSVIS